MYYAFLAKLLFIRETLDLTIEEPNDTFSEEISQNAMPVIAVSTPDATASTSATSTASHVKKQTSKISMLTIIQIIENLMLLGIDSMENIKI